MTPEPPNRILATKIQLMNRNSEAKIFRDLLVKALVALETPRYFHFDLIDEIKEALNPAKPGQTQTLEEKTK